MGIRSRGQPMSQKTFNNQSAIRGPWRAYLDSIAPYRRDLHGYCRRLTGNVWDGEDLMQDTRMRVFSLRGRTDAKLETPRAYLIRAATHIWIDRLRRSAREQAALTLEAPAAELPSPDESLELRDAARR